MITAVNPYLNFPGTTEKAFEFYQSIFGGEFLGVQRFKDVEGMENLSKEDEEKIMHIALPLSNGIILMASDILESMGHSHRPGKNVYLSLNVDSKEEADRLFAALSEGGDVEMPMKNTFWGDYFGIAIDKFEIQWMISYTLPEEG